jgi:hypothetical protein
MSAVASSGKIGSRYAFTLDGDGDRTQQTVNPTESRI